MKLGWGLASFSVVGSVSWVVLGWEMTLASGSDAGDSETPLGQVAEERGRLRVSLDLHQLESYLCYLNTVRWLSTDARTSHAARVKIVSAWLVLLIGGR